MGGGKAQASFSTTCVKIHNVVDILSTTISTIISTTVDIERDHDPNLFGWVSRASVLTCSWG